jgi:hypothetical protein
VLLLQRTIKDHEETLDGNSPRDFIDTYLIEMKKRDAHGNSIFTGKLTCVQKFHLKYFINTLNVVFELFISVKVTDRHFREHVCS